MNQDDKNLRYSLEGGKTFEGQYDRGHITIKDGEELIDTVAAFRR